MKVRKLLLTLVLILALASAVCAQEVIRFADLNAQSNPHTNPCAAYEVVFKDIVEKLSGGDIKVEIYFGGSLGTETELLQAVMAGDIEIAVVASGTVATELGIPEFDLPSIPYLFDNEMVMYELAKRNSPVMKMFNELLKEKNAGFYIELPTFGFRHFTNNVRPIHEPKDMKGLKFRVMPMDSFVKMVEATGATAIPIPWVEVFTSLDTGLVDGQENPTTNITMANLEKVQKYLTLDGHVGWYGGYGVNTAWFDGLSEEHKSIVWRAMDIASMTYFTSARLNDALALKQIKETKSMEVYMPTEEEKQKFKEICRPPVIQLLKNRGVSEETINNFINIVDEYTEEVKNSAVSY